MLRNYKHLLQSCSCILVATLIIQLIWGDTISFATHDLRASNRQLRSDIACNALSYVYIVGVEGVGHHAVSPAIATIAKTCSKHVLYEMKLLRNDQRLKSSHEFQAHIAKLRSTPFPSHDVVILEDSSFPNGLSFRNATSQDPRSANYYDLMWLHKELKVHGPGAKAKYLHLTRDFYRTVASHPEFDGGFERHAQVLHSFMQLINSEYTKISKTAPGSWKQINYEWFTNMKIHNCTAVVSALIDFMEWDNCDVEFACHALGSVVRSERKKEVIPSDYEYAQTFNVNLPIPVLDITPNRTYSFKTAMYRHPDGYLRDHNLNKSVLSVLYDAPPKPEYVRSSLSTSAPPGSPQGVRGGHHPHQQHAGLRYKAPQLAQHCHQQHHHHQNQHHGTASSVAPQSVRRS